MFELTYKKNDNSKLFETLEKENLMNIKNIQNYIPIFEKFFTVNSKNYNSINLNQKYRISEIYKKCNDNTLSCKIVNDTNNDEIKTDVFFKYSPLIDPIKYMIGKYEKCNDDIFQLPQKENKNDIHKNIIDPNNSAYIDGFFSYLTSQLLHNHNFFHGIDFYGIFLGIKNNFKTSITDELDILNDSDYFHKNKGELFVIDESFQNNFMNVDSRKYKNNIKIHNNSDKISVHSFNNDDEYKEIFKIFDVTQSTEVLNIDNSLQIFNSPTKRNRSDSSLSSSCSSRSSLTSNEDDDTEKDTLDFSSNELTFENIKKLHRRRKSRNNASESSGYDEESGSESGSYSSSFSESDSVDSIITTVNSFPVCVIGLEKCDKTLDYLIMNNDNKEITFDQWKSILMQIIMTLIMYQKVFDFTHNDLHTNNIMYQETDKKNLIYMFNGKYYKVPTYGKIFKIIDFGRAIYKFKGNRFCSNSFSPDGDATTQYNIEPYLNKNKPVLEPNKSFDLCRLACSLFDFFFDDINEAKNMKPLDDPIAHLINEWCIDDKGRNILYKNNNRERYPDFKLYKMIARSVHNHTPEKQLEREIFDSYRIPKKKINKKVKIMNIDIMPSYC